MSVGLEGLPRLRVKPPQRLLMRGAADEATPTPPTAGGHHNGSGSSDLSYEDGDEQQQQPPLSPVSQLFLGLGDAAPDIYAILRLRGSPTMPEITAKMAVLVAAHDRFRARVSCRGGVWSMHLLDGFDAAACMREATLPGRDVEAAFNAYVSELMCGPPLAEGELPPWDCHVVRHAGRPDVTHVLLRCSHMIGDGQLFMRLLKNVLEEEEGGDEGEGDEADGRCRGAGVGTGAGGSDAGGRGPSTSSGGGSGSRGPSEPGSPLIRAVHSGSAFPPPPRGVVAAAAGGGLRGAGRGSAAATGTAPTPAEALRRAGRRLTKVVAAAWAWLTSVLFVLTMPLRPADPVNAVKASHEDMSGPRAFSSVALPLGEMRRVAKALDVTINTLAVSCIAGGLRRYLLARGGGNARLPAATAAARAALGLPFERAGSDSVPERLMLCSIVDTRAMRRAAEEAKAAKAAARRRAAAQAAAASSAGGSSIGGSSSIMSLSGAASSLGGASSCAGLSAGGASTASLCSSGGVSYAAAANAVPAAAGGAAGATGAAADGCNTLSFIGVPVLTGPAPPLARLASVARSLAWVRSSFAVLIAVLMPPVIQFLFRDAATASAVLAYLLPAKTTLAFSNMRGPSRRVALAGYRVERMYNGVQPSSFGCFVSLMSYGDDATLAASCWASKCGGRPRELLDAIAQEWRALRAAALGGAALPSAGGAASPAAKLGKGGRAL